tara:strand:+ start:55 stop:411 length:357 start_codon:yes stop_codon:yes gene_type:complete
MPKDEIKIINEHWEEFTIFNDACADNIVFDCVFKLQYIYGEPEVQYFSNGDPGTPATPDEIELLAVTINSVNIYSELMDTIDEIELTPISRKAFAMMLFEYVNDNIHIIEFRAWENQN